MSGSVHDGVRTHHFRLEVDRPVAAEAAARIAEIVQSTPEVVELQELHDFLAEHDTLGIADALGRELVGASGSRVGAVGRWLAEYGTRRNAVATGIVLIGLSRASRHRDLLLLLGAMEELTLFAAVALERTQDDRDWAMYELARRVRAWGRIHCVERLKDTSDPDIKAWLLRHGFRNDIMDEYLALIAATTGDLAGALMTSEVDDELLDGAGGVIAALCVSDGGPADGMDHYPDGPAVLDRYLDLVRARPSVDRIRAVLSISDYVKDDRCQEILTDLDWIDSVRTALDSADLDTCMTAIWPATRLGLRFHDKVPGWLERDPYEGYFWHELSDIDTVTRLAERLLPLADLASGPADDLGIGRDYAPDRALTVVVSKLAAHPGHGWPLVRTALANRVVRNRHEAVRVLKSWPRDKLPPDAANVVRAAEAVEPNARIRAGLMEFLQVSTGLV